MTWKYLFFFGSFTYFCNCLETFSVSFEDEIIRGRASAKCTFKILYNDEAVLNVDVRCRNVKKVMSVDYVHQTTTMHKITFKMKISKNGRTRIGSRQIVRGKLVNSSSSY